MAQNRFPKTNGSTRRGQRYDAKHQAARRTAAKHHDPSHVCTRCQQPLGPMGPWLHYDHTDDGGSYLGFAHAACNRTAGAIEGARRQAANTARHTRIW